MITVLSIIGAVVAIICVFLILCFIIVELSGQSLGPKS